MNKCARCGEKTEKKKIVRRANTCGDCFALLNADNQARYRLNMKIPNNFKLIIDEIGYNYGSGKRRKRWKKSRLMLNII